MQIISQRFSIDEFSGEEGQTIHFAKLKHRENVRLVQRRCDFRFLQKALHASLVLRDVGREHFQCNGAIESRVAREVNFAHAARTERIENDVGTEMLSFIKRLDGVARLHRWSITVRRLQPPRRP